MDAQTQADIIARLRAELARAEDKIADLQEDKDRLHRQLDAAESRAHAAETR